MKRMPPSPRGTTILGDVGSLTPCGHPEERFAQAIRLRATHPIGKHLVSQKLWGAKVIGAAIDRTPKQTYYLLNKGLIRSARRVGDQWVVDKDDLQHEFSAAGAAPDRGSAA